MKIIDEKGKLFGKVNLFDLFILSLLILIVVFGLNKYTNKLDVRPVATKEITCKLFINNIRDVTRDTIQVGDELTESETNGIMGEILEKEVMASTKHVTTEAGKVVNAEVPGRYDMLLTVKGQGIVTDEDIILGSKTIRLGAQIKVKTNKYEVSTTIFGINYEE